MSIGRPSDEEIHGPAVELSLLLVRRMFLDRLERQLDVVARTRAVASGAEATAPTHAEVVVGAGNLRTLASLAEAWVGRPDLVRSDDEASLAELGVLAVLDGVRSQGGPAWAALSTPLQGRLVDAAAAVGALQELQRGLIRSRLSQVGAAVESTDRDLQFEGWWRQLAGDAPLPVGSESEAWLTEAGHGPERWVQECARALVDAFFHDLETDPATWPVRTLTEMPFPVESHGDDPREDEIELHFWFLDALDQLEYAAHPDAPDVVEAVQRARKSATYMN